MTARGMHGPVFGSAAPAVVAIPARDEAERIEDCLRALADQCDRQGRRMPPSRYCVLVLANNCADDTAARVRHLADCLPCTVLCHEVALHGSHVGVARRTALELAADLLLAHGREDGVILTTDADTRVQPTWLHGNLDAIARGADAVAGVIDFDPRESPAFPLLLGNRHLEARYADLSDELVARLDPRPHDPWPNHRWAWGASLAVRLSTYRSVGGLPAVPLAEDRAFLAALEAADAKVRHSLTVRVWTSSRTTGRAPGGLADLLRSFAEHEDALCDAMLEPAALTFQRAAWRGRLRRAHACGDGDHESWAERLGLPPEAGRAWAGKSFGRLWQAIEGASPRLAPQRLHPGRLAGEIASAERALRWLRRIRRRTSRR